ncbi:conjugative transposon protein TraJ [Nibrella saemangeumensis]|uniref:Conjugative transposon protein TraJ n=1 Tax=Nibrella saemangeumensis TaxID=1084526 RepID=A0ABP8NBD7_9BACT
MEQALDNLYQGMRGDFGMLIDFGRSIGFLGAVFYVFYRIWGHLARNEPIDVFPLLRPFSLALCLLCYTYIVDAMVTIGNGLALATEQVVASKETQVIQLNQKKDELLKQKMKEIAGVYTADGELSYWELGKDFFGRLFSVDNSVQRSGVSFLISTWIDELLKSVTRVLFDAVTLGIKIIATYFLIIMAICGPITIGLSCFEWFYGSLGAWFARFIHILLWIPVANIFGGIIEEVHIIMLQSDIAQIQAATAETFTATDFMEILFYIIGTAGYLLVPLVSTWILESTGVGNAIGNLSRPFTAPATAAMGVMGGAVGTALGSGFGAARGSVAPPIYVYPTPSATTPAQRPQPVNKV